MNVQKKGLTTGLLVAILLLALGLRFYRLGAQSLWNDEGTSVAVAQRDPATIARDAAQDIHPPLYYWLLGGWVRLAGTSEAAVRSLSALLGVALVALTYLLGRLLAGRWAGLAAAFLAAIDPFQVYYSQEARMYILAAFLAAGAVLALLRLVDHSPMSNSRGLWAPLLALVGLEAAGLYTHYSFVFVILVLNLAYLLQLRRNGGTRQVWPWAGSQIAVVLLYLPWLPIAVRQATTWPSPAQAIPLLPALATTWRWLAFGPTIETAAVALPLLAAALLALAGVISLAAGWVWPPAPRKAWNAGLLALWVGLPVILMAAFGLYREAYLKFLLVTTPAVGVLLACGLLNPLPTVRDTADQKPRSTFPLSRFSSRLLSIASRAAPFTAYASPFVQALGVLLIVVPSGLALRNYYVNPAYARDDYRDIAAYVQALERPGDAIVLDAPGQQEVFGYYYQGTAPVYALPRSRPLDPAATEAALQGLAQPGGRVFAVLWATDESDPERFVESWLDSHAYKALDAWYGNVRLAVYAVPERTPSAPDHTLAAPLQSAETGDEIELVGYSLLNERLRAGDIAQVALFWRADRTPTQRFKVFLHVLDEGNHIVGQRDAEPGGGARLTTLWEPGELVVDRYGLPIDPATPPGTYRVEVGMYSPDDGQRLTTPDGASQVWLAPLEVERPLAPAPIAALEMEHTAGVDLGELTLLGYDVAKLGFAHQPAVPLQPSDTLEVSLYWQVAQQPSGDWQVAIELLDPKGQKRAEIVAVPVDGYPTSRWQPGDVWRGQFNLAIPGDAPPGRYRLRVRPVAPDGSSPGSYLSEPFEVGR
jgi:mannosyltransferase